MDLLAEGKKRAAWTPTEQEEFTNSLIPKVKAGTEVMVVYMDSGLDPVKPGCIGEVISIQGSEVRVIFPKLSVFNKKKSPAIMYWYELALTGVANPMEQHLRKMIAGR